AARVATTYRVFSQTNDEPFHLAAGYDFLLTGRQTSDPQHPPLARVFFALPFLRTPPPASTDGLTRGNALLLRDDRYTQNLGRARIGNLLFLAIGIAAVALWARHLISPAAGLIDRKSTRLNSSHRTTSYAVFFLKKKEEPITTTLTSVSCVSPPKGARV